jgi:hypothetical protein
MSLALTPEEREAFLARPHTAVLTFSFPDGRSMAVPVWTTWTGDVFRFQSGPDSIKTASFRREGRASICLHEDTDQSVIYVTAEGPVDEVPFDLDRDIGEPAARYLGPERGAAFAAAFVDRPADSFAAFELTPQTWWSRDYAKTPVADLLLNRSV